MDEPTRTRLARAIKSVFDEADEAQVTLLHRLGEFPGWDSMKGINLQIAIEAEFGISLNGELFVESQTVDGLLKIIEHMQSRS